MISIKEVSAVSKGGQGALLYAKTIAHVMHPCGVIPITNHHAWGKPQLAILDACLGDAFSLVDRPQSRLNRNQIRDTDD